MGLFGGYDGSIKIDSKIDTKGFSEGTKDMENISEDAAGTIASNFDEAWERMGWGEKQEVIAKTVEIYGQLWDTMGPEEQRVALEGVVRGFNEAAEAADTAKSSIEEAAEATTKVSDATKTWSTQSKGISRILSAMVPGLYRVRRAAVGFNEINAEMGKTITLLGIIKLSALALVAVTALLAIGFVLIAKKVWNWAKTMTDTLYSSLATTSAFRDKVVELKTAFDNVKGAVMGLGATLLNALMPIIMKVVDWLIKAINFIAMLIASLTGQKTVLQYVAGSMSSAAGSAERIEKAAKGALAAFDELNVLEITDPEVPTGGVGGVGGAATMIEVAVPVDFAKKAWEDFKDWFGKNVIEPVKQKLLDFKNWYHNTFPTVEEGESQVDRWMGSSDWVIAEWEKIKDAANLLYNIVVHWFEEAWVEITKIYDQVSEWWYRVVVRPVVEWCKWAGYWIGRFLADPLGTIKLAWNTLSSWFITNVWQPLDRATGETLGEMFLKFLSFGNNVGNFFNTLGVNIANAFIDMANSVIRSLNDIIRGINSVQMPWWDGGGSSNIKLIGAIPNVSSRDANWWKTPRLATGAVIPPNSAFAAILGDQTSGINIETPEKLLRQIIREEIGQGGQDITVTMPVYIDGEKVYEGQKRIEWRRGESLIKSGAM